MAIMTISELFMAPCNCEPYLQGPGASEALSAACCFSLVIYSLHLYVLHCISVITATLHNYEHKVTQTSSKLHAIMQAAARTDPCTCQQGAVLKLPTHANQPPNLHKEHQ